MLKKILPRRLSIFPNRNSVHRRQYFNPEAVQRLNKFKYDIPLCPFTTATKCMTLQSINFVTERTVIEEYEPTPIDLINRRISAEVRSKIQLGITDA